MKTRDMRTQTKECIPFTLLLGKVWYKSIGLKSSELYKYWPKIPSALLLNDTLFSLVVRKKDGTLYIKKGKKLRTLFWSEKQPYYWIYRNYCSGYESYRNSYKNIEAFQCAPPPVSLVWYCHVGFALDASWAYDFSLLLKFTVLHLSLILRTCLSVIWDYLPNYSSTGWLENCCLYNS